MKEILIILGFDMIRESIDEVIVAAPFHKPDISLPADVVEEIVRIDGFDNIEIPASVTVTPSVEENPLAEIFREKVASYLVGLGFHEIMTNSITNEVYFDEVQLQESVKMLNSLSVELNIMRPSMLETGLESIVYNLNRKNNDLKFFDFGRTYSTTGPGKYSETENLCLYITGNAQEDGWRNKTNKTDFYFLKGIVEASLKLLGLKPYGFEGFTHGKLSPALRLKINGSVIIQLGSVDDTLLKRFDIKQPVYFADFNWNAIIARIENSEIKIDEIPKFPIVYRDVALVISNQLKYEDAEVTVQKLNLKQLQKMQLFDIFESEKLGKDKKSMAIRFTFIDKEKTLTDNEIDQMMNAIMMALEKDLHADIRR